MWARLKYEGGVHRVQRVPVTESQGRIHTSAAGVLVLPEAEDVDVEIDPNDLRIDVYRSSGPGGQSVNTTDSAVRITHVPTGIVASCQNEKSQLQNREQAMRILRARLLAAAQEAADQEASDARRSQVRTVDRSERVRTYNFAENRIADHRVNYKAYNLDQVLDGDLDAVVQALVDADTEAKLARRGSVTCPTALQAAAGRRDRVGSRRPACRRPGTTPRSWPRTPSASNDVDLWRHDDARAASSRRTSSGGPPVSRCSTSPGWRTSATSTLRSGPGSSCPGRRRRCVVDAALEGAARHRPARVVVDLCTGSGAIALAVATEVPGRGCTRSSWSRRRTPGRCATARASPVELRLGDMATAFPELDGTVDVVVSNPPYIPVGAVVRDPEVAAHDPAGVAVVRRRRPGRDARRRAGRRPAAATRRPGGGRARRPPGRARRRPSSPTPTRWRDVADHRDLAGRDRFVTAVREDRS